ncbi:conjugative transposon protein TraN [Agriterribacter sp.]|uniref:conjugative transposon protein TraN n=1 Tax=Agriterribacter sp. TaxID=2821509 RepID=UPI002D1B0651|nr:conjugative transposon protein TraN [Agriterribacter sp.]HTN05143.1 conjugative transposon protein TraN [Agriterribacter sp.]
MKKLLLLVCGFILLSDSHAQTKELNIATDKTISLVFPFPVRHVDRGTRDILVQQVKEADNILLVKAAGKEFVPTNLSVITQDGSLYSFSVLYNADPVQWIYKLPANTKVSIATYSNGVLDNPATMSGIKDHKWDMEAAITGIYIKENVMYYQLRLKNYSPIDYDIDFLRFYIRDKKKGKRTATQENELKPLYIAGNIRQVKGNDQGTLVVALDKFTIPDAKYMAVEINERNGGRHLLMKIKNSRIIRAIPLPDLH